MMYICRYCNKVLKRSCALGIHERTCKLNPNRKPLENHVCGYAVYSKKRSNENYHYDKDESLVCKYCGKQCYSVKSLKAHECKCPQNKNRVYRNGMIGKRPWNKGLTKETDGRVKQAAISLKLRYENGELKSPQKGIKHTEQEKQHLSDIRKKYLKEHPNKVPYVLNHHSHGDSYCEKFFKQILNNEHIEYEQNYYQFGYFLDFAFPITKTYFEVDGEQHYLDERIVKHDKKRTEVLQKNGWTCLFRIRWSRYQKMPKECKERFIKNIIQKIKNATVA